MARDFIKSKLSYPLAKVTFIPAGVTWRPKEDRAAVREGDAVSFVAEPHNKYDSFAIKVIAHGENDDYHIGYIPAELAERHYEKLVDQGMFDGIISNNKLDTRKNEHFPEVKIRILSYDGGEDGWAQRVEELYERAQEAKREK